MEMNLHRNARTTPRTRDEIRRSAASVTELARVFGISETTVRRWRGRSSTDDRSSRPTVQNVSLTPAEEAIALALRQDVGLSLDDVTEVMRRCLKADLSRSAVYRCLRRHGVAGRVQPEKAPVLAFETDTPAGFVHLDVKHLTRLHGEPAYAFVAIDRATRFAYVEVLPDRKADTAASFLRRFLLAFPLRVHTVLTDNGSEFTDRFAVDMKNKPDGQPSGRHPVDRLCAQNAIRHRLTKPFRPQTNGMVERFNRRLADHLNSMPRQRAGHRRAFNSHAERNRFLLTFVADYNRTRLQCLGYKAPLEILSNLTEQNTFAGVTEMLENIASWMDTLGPARVAHQGQAVSVARTPSSCSIASRIRNFCILPVTVIGKSGTNRMWRGTL